MTLERTRFPLAAVSAVPALADGPCLAEAERHCKANQPGATRLQGREADPAPARCGALAR